MSKLITIFTPNSEAEHLIAKSMLEAAGIKYFSKNEQVQSLFGLGQIGSGYNLAAGPIQIQVAETDAGIATAALEGSLSNRDVDDYSIPELCPACNSSTKGLNQCPDCGLVFITEVEEKDQFEEPKNILEIQRKINALITKSILFGVFWIGGIGSILSIYFGIKALKLIETSDGEMRGLFKAMIGLLMGCIGFIAAIFVLYDFMERFA